ncbi:MAG: hypothetical protein LBG97_09765 [Coriobacteriales bacterium]|jgi:hypothetical protein|nr:hypothetical protein [Coriobacteriales bacterium]
MKNWLDNKNVQEKVRIMKRPPFDFSSDPEFDRAVIELAHCLERKDYLWLPAYEDAVHMEARRLSDPNIQKWAIDYYGYEGWAND